MSEPVLTAAGVKLLDARLERAGLLDLAMEEAGRAVADALQLHFLAGRALLLAGGGANGGDALVAARHLLAGGREVRVLALPSRHPLTRLNRKRLGNVGGTVTLLNSRSLKRELQNCGVVLDGLLGTGFAPPLRPALAEIIRLVNASGVPVVAADLPSGLSAELAAVEGEPIRASHTVTFSGWKTALLFGPAAHFAGQVDLAPLRLPPGWALEQAEATRPSDGEVAALLPVRFADAHKGTAGNVWVIGGHPGTTGAPALAGLGALRAGAGLVSLYSRAEVPLIAPELMLHREADLSAVLAAIPQARRPDAVCLGMGLGPDAVGLAQLVLDWGIPTVLDADALQPELAGQGHDHCVWTPHPGEAARLLGLNTSEITRDPLGAARALQHRLGGVVVLKGGPTTLASADGLWVSTGGHPGMATAGMGDTLSGILAALLAQGLSPLEAALAGVTLHARAGERAGARFGYGLTATDVSRELGTAWLELVAKLKPQIAP